MTGAVTAMREGALRQPVAVEGGGEIATLAMAFNQTSEEFAQRHEALLQSNNTILEAANKLKAVSIRGALTDLCHRRHFDEQAQQLCEQSVRHGRPMVVVMGDIDFFKRINDTCSHATGDAVLKQIAEVLRTHMRTHTRISDVVARYGGEEFVNILPETPKPRNPRPPRCATSCAGHRELLADQCASRAACDDESMGFLRGCRR